MQLDHEFTHETKHGNKQLIPVIKSVKYDRPGECSPKKDCLW